MRTIDRVAMLTLALALTVSSTALAQDKWFAAVTYQAAMPTGDTKAFSDDFSWRNIGIEWRNMVQPNLSVGFATAWNVFAEQTDEVVSLGGFDASGTQFRYVNAFPLLLTAHYYVVPSRPMLPRPYLGVGVGTYFIENRLTAGTTGITSKNWHLGLAPEAGVVLPVNRYSAAFVNAKFNYALEAGDVTHTYWTFAFGMAWRK
jgi:outer membrane protein W